MQTVPCCSFCGADADSVRWLIQNRDVYICNKCVEICAKLIELADKGELEEKVFVEGEIDLNSTDD